MSDWIACYGFAPFPLTYEDFVGLELNRARAEERKVYFAALAHAVAESLAEVPLSVVRSVCETERQAKQLAQEMNSQRKLAQLGW